MSDDEIVRALAESVFGLTDIVPIEVIIGKGTRKTFGTTRRYQLSDGRWAREAKELPNPLTNDADSCAVLDKMAADWDFNIVKRQQHSGAFVGCYFDKPSVTPAAHFHFELPYSPEGRRRAVAIAALKAVGKWVE